MSIAAALFAPAQAKVLGYLFGQPHRWFHLNELIRTTGLGSASVQREGRYAQRSAYRDGTFWLRSPAIGSRPHRLTLHLSRRPIVDWNDSA